MIISFSSHEIPNLKPETMYRSPAYIRIFFCFWLPLFIFSATTLNAHTSPTYYYVSPGGVDANPGTESLPWKTLAKAASMDTAGVTVYIRQGTYNERLIPLYSGTAVTLLSVPAYSQKKLPFQPLSGNKESLKVSGKSLPIMLLYHTGYIRIKYSMNTIILPIYKF